MKILKHLEKLLYELHERRYSLPKREISFQLEFSQKGVGFYPEYSVDYSDTHEDSFLHRDYLEWESLAESFNTATIPPIFELNFQSVDDGYGGYNYPTIHIYKDFNGGFNDDMIDDCFELAERSKNQLKENTNGNIFMYISCFLKWDNHNNPILEIDTTTYENEFHKANRDSFLSIISFTEQYVNYYNEIMKLFTNSADFLCAYKEEYAEEQLITLDEIKQNAKLTLEYFDNFKGTAVGSVTEHVALFVTSNPNTENLESIYIEHEGANFRRYHYYTKKSVKALTNITHVFWDKTEDLIPSRERNKPLSPMVNYLEKSTERNLTRALYAHLKDSIHKNIFQEQGADFKLYLTKGEIHELIYGDGMVYGLNKNSELVFAYKVYTQDTRALWEEKSFIQKLNEIIVSWK